MSDPDLQFELDELREQYDALMEAHEGLVVEAQILRQQVLSDERFFRDLPEAPPNDWRRLAMAVRKFLIYSDKRRQALADGKVAEIEDVLRAYTVQMDTGLKTLLGELT